MVTPSETGQPAIALAQSKPSRPSPAFTSIVFQRPQSEEEIDQRPAPTIFGDLNLDQLFTSIASGREEYNLSSLFCAPLDEVGDITYRHEALRDLEDASLRDQVAAFAAAMRTVRQHPARITKPEYYFHQAGWFLDGVDTYCGAVARFAEELSCAGLESNAFRGLRDYLVAYVASDRFTGIRAEAKKVKDDLATVTYSIVARGDRFTVTKYGGEPDYSVEVEETFRKFRQGDVKDYRMKFPQSGEIDHIAGIVLDSVARLHPEIFQGLRLFCERHPDYIDPTIRRFDREVQLYLAYLEFMQPLVSAGLKFSYPRVSAHSKEVQANETFDLVLANKLRQEGRTVVTNDFHLKGRERIFVVSGPNNGGKTTFARTFGQLHYLASLGYPVPGRDTQLFLYDQLFTHFEREEHIENLRGKLQDELIRIHQILERATGGSIIVMNESFASTTLEDALFLGREIIQQLVRRDMLAVYVTFIDELASLDEATVSMVSTVVPDNPAQRTFRVVRKPADGLAHAAALADKYGLGYGSVKRRIAR